jgi:hypothetical protein
MATLEATYQLSRLSVPLPHFTALLSPETIRIYLNFVASALDTDIACFVSATVPNISSRCGFPK